MTQPNDPSTRAAESELDVAISPVKAVSAGSIEISIKPTYTHHFAGVVFYNDAVGATPLDPATLTGSTAFTVKTVTQPHGPQSPNNPTVSADTYDQADWSGNTESVLATFTSITGATHARLFVSSNKT